MKRFFLAGVVALFLGSCADWKLSGWSGFGSASGSSDLTIASSRGGYDDAAGGGAALAPRFGTAVYRAADGSTADFFLTDLPMDRLFDRDDTLAGVSGTLVHVSFFLKPKAGRTPIDDTACNASVRCLVVADGAMGLYAGGGFVTAGDFGKENVSGQVRGATVKLVRGSNDFVDLLGPSGVDGAFTCAYNDEAARALAGRMADVSATLRSRR